MIGSRARRETDKHWNVDVLRQVRHQLLLDVYRLTGASWSNEKQRPAYTFTPQTCTGIEVTSISTRSQRFYFHPQPSRPVALPSLPIFAELTFQFHPFSLK